MKNCWTLLISFPMVIRKQSRGSVNGLALCKLHHTAFDSNILGVRPDLVIEVRKDVLDETDGPMLQHGLKECHERKLIVLPASNQLKPRRDFLEERYELFRTAR